MAVDFATFSQIVNHVTAVRKPVLLRGSHGIGKSTVVYQYAAQQSMEVVERRASQMTAGDLVGLPSIEATQLASIHLTGSRLQIICCIVSRRG